MTRQVVLLAVCCLAAVGLRGQCPDADAVAQRIRTIKDAPTDQWQSACSRLKNQLERCRSISDSNYAQVLFLLGYAHSYTGDYSQAIQLTQASIRINEKSAPNTAPLSRIQAYYYLGNYLRSANQPMPAFEAYQRCISLGSQLPAESSNITRSLIGQAQVLYLRGDYEQALRKAQDSYRMVLGQRDQLLLAECSIEIARNQVSLGDLESAEKMAETAIQLASNDPYGSDVESQSRRILAIIYQTQNRANEALREYTHTAAVYNKMGDFDQAAHNYNSIGYLYWKKFVDYPKAQFYFEKAYSYFRDADNKAVCLNNMGALYRAKGQYDSAFNYLQRALHLLPIAFTAKSIVQNPPAQAIRLITHEEILLSIMQDKADTWLDYANATHNRQRLRYALDAYRIADEMIDIMRWQQTGQQSKLYWRQKTRGMYQRAIETCYRLGDAEGAFRFFEKSRAVMLADKLNELGARLQLAPQQASREKRLRQTVNDQQTELARLAVSQPAYKPAQQALLAMQDSLETFLKKLELSNPAYYRYKYDNATPALADMQRYLTTRKAAFVTYFVGDSALYVLGLTSRGATLLRQPEGGYNPTVRAFMGLLANPDGLNRQAAFGRFIRLGNSLYRQLLSPLHLPKGRVIVSPDGTFVPFEAVSRSATKPVYLVNDYAFSYTYSARLLLKTNAGPTPSASPFERDFVGVAPVSFARSLKQVSLPGSDEALKPIAAQFSSPELLTHQAATRRAFLTQAAQARVIHLFTHAVADDSAGSQPLLYFADSTLQLADLGDGGLLKAQLVVLAACKTGVGANQRGEGVFSLARGFAALGAPSVLTTLWSVENKATYQITNSFYRFLADGLPKDEALQRAQAEWLGQAEGENQLPNYWAGLILVGDTEPLSRRVYWPWLAGAGLLLGGVGLVLWQWRAKRRAKQYNPAIGIGLRSR